MREGVRGATDGQELWTRVIPMAPTWKRAESSPGQLLDSHRVLQHAIGMVGDLDIEGIVRIGSTRVEQEPCWR